MLMNKIYYGYLLGSHWRQFFVSYFFIAISQDLSQNLKIFYQFKEVKIGKIV